VESPQKEGGIKKDSIFERRETTKSATCSDTQHEREAPIQGIKRGGGSQMKKLRYKSVKGGKTGMKDAFAIKQG